MPRDNKEGIKIPYRNDKVWREDIGSSVITYVDEDLGIAVAYSYNLEDTVDIDLDELLNAWTDRYGGTWLIGAEP